MGHPSTSSFEVYTSTGRDEERRERRDGDGVRTETDGGDGVRGDGGDEGDGVRRRRGRSEGDGVKSFIITLPLRVSRILCKRGER